MNIVLVEPEIPPNTGNVARVCAATNSRLHLIEPLGFKLDNTQLKRAGMDYWHQVEWQRWANWNEFFEAAHRAVSPPRFWFVESDGAKNYAEVNYLPDDYLIFGRETAGLPKILLEKYPENWLRIPMFNPKSRSLNLSNCVSLVLYEALRQQGFHGEV